MGLSFPIYGYHWHTGITVCFLFGSGSGKSTCWWRITKIPVCYSPLPKEDRVPSSLMDLMLCLPCLAILRCCQLLHLLHPWLFALFLPCVPSRGDLIYKFCIFNVLLMTHRASTFLLNHPALSKLIHILLSDSLSWTPTSCLQLRSFKSPHTCSSLLLS